MLRKKVRKTTIIMTEETLKGGGTSFKWDFKGDELTRDAAMTLINYLLREHRPRRVDVG